ncbi:hypothetical protein [Nonomuraea sp. B1E8]|uniref:hypothetical protein n=1 Tax=unclassified Nonomuraea TaxID=2593643 RepID=UPI00325F2538
MGAALVGGIADAGDMRVAFAAPLVPAAALSVLAPGFEPRSRTGQPAPITPSR